MATAVILILMFDDVFDDFVFRTKMSSEIGWVCVGFCFAK